MKNILLIYILLSALTSSGQIKLTKYYKHSDLFKEVPEKRARFKQIEFLSGDTLVVELYNKNDNQLIKKSYWLHNNPVGIWKTYNNSGLLITKRNFSELIYISENPTDIFDNIVDSLCKNCSPASYPNGESEMFKFIGANIEYPLEAANTGKQGVVYIRFIVDINGDIHPHSIMRGVDPILDMAAWQVIKKMPKWNPAILNGAPVKTYINFPIRFILK